LLEEKPNKEQTYINTHEKICLETKRGSYILDWFRKDSPLFYLYLYELLVFYFSLFLL